MSEEQKPVIVLDNGTGYLKAGLCDEKEPRTTLPAMVGRPMLRYGEKVEDIELKPIMIGDEVTPVRSMLQLSYPIEEGIIRNKEDMEILWDYCINKKLEVSQDDYPNRRILLTEAPSNPNKNKILMGEIALEQMKFRGFNIEPQAMLTLYCEGLETGIVFDSGDGVSHCIPISSSFILHHFIERINIAGRHITNNLNKLLQLR